MFLQKNLHSISALTCAVVAAHQVLSLRDPENPDGELPPEMRMESQLLLDEVKEWRVHRAHIFDDLLTWLTCTASDDSHYPFEFSGGVHIDPDDLAAAILRSKNPEPTEKLN